MILQPTLKGSGPFLTATSLTGKCTLLCQLSSTAHDIPGRARGADTASASSAPGAVPRKGKDEALPCLLRGDHCLPKTEPHNALSQQYLLLPQWKQFWLVCWWFQSYIQQLQPRDWKVLVPYEAPMAACRQLGYFLWSVGSGTSPQNAPNCFAESLCPGSGKMGLMPSRSCWFCGVCVETRSPTPCRTLWC